MLNSLQTITFTNYLSNIQSWIFLSSSVLRFIIEYSLDSQLSSQAKLFLGDSSEDGDEVTPEEVCGRNEESLVGAMDTAEGRTEGNHIEVVTAPGIVTDVRPVHSENAETPILLTGYSNFKTPMPFS